MQAFSIPPYRADAACGFSLLELAITLVILAILATLVIPAYQNQLRQARRTDGQNALLAITLAQERFRAQCPAYAATLTGTRACQPETGVYVLGLNETSAEGYYRLALDTASATGYRASALPLGDQAQDRARGSVCDPLTIDQAGATTPDACWP